MAPVPSYPCAQASGAWICGTLSSSVDRTVPFSHTLPAPARRASVALRSACSPRSDSQTSRISSFAPSTATMPTESRTCTLSAASGVAGARLASGPPRPWSSSGSSALESSSRRLLTRSVTLNRFSSSTPDCTYGSASAGTTCTCPSCSYTTAGREPSTAGSTTDAPCVPSGDRCQATTSPVSSVTRASDAGASPVGAVGAVGRSGSAAAPPEPRPPSGRPRVTRRTSASSRDRTDRAERGVGISAS